GPPPYGTSSTTRWRSVVKSRKSRIFTSMRPLATARPMIPAANDCSIIAGKIVTMSKVGTGLAVLPTAAFSVQFQQTWRRLDHDSFRPRADAPPTPLDQRNQHPAATPPPPHPPPPGRPSNIPDAAAGLPRPRPAAAANKVVRVKRPRRQRCEPL